MSKCQICKQYLRLIDVVIDNPDINWNFNCLSKNPSITMFDVLNNSKLNWNFEELSKNPSITITDVLNNLKLSWNF